jgi:hypothetical protein
MLPLSNDWLLFLRFKHKDQTTLWNFDLSTALKKKTVRNVIFMFIDLMM